MSAAPNLAAVGALVGDPTRALMLDVLQDGRAWTASELARAAGVTPQTASSHLQKLVEGSLLVVDARGRHRYFRLSGPDVAEALESLSLLASRRTVRPGLRSAGDEPLQEARTCYDHLAGRLGVSLIESLTRQRYFREDDDGYRVTPKGGRGLAELGIDVEQARRQRRSFARKCLDWSERRCHLGGALGAALADRLFELRWLQRIADSRAVSVTPRGRRALRDLGLSI